MLYNNVNYTSDISYLTNCFIHEYDLSKANINVLYTKKLIDKNTYNYLYNSERMIRQVYVGKLIKENSNIYQEIKNGIIDAKRMLFETNNIQDYEVLSIKNDAVFIINKNLKYTKFGLLDFKNKNNYTGFFKIKNLELYYYYNSINKDEILDVKGIDDNTLIQHNNYMMQLFKDIFYTLQMSSVSNAIQMLNDFYKNYISYNVPVGYYRMFDNKSLYHFKHSSFVNTGFASDNVLDKDKTNLDIMYNLSLLLDLQKILTSIYFNKI